MLTARSRVRPGSGWSPASVTVVHSCSCAIILVWCKEGSWFGASPNPGRGLSEPAYSIIFIETDGDPCKRSLCACGQQRWCGDDGATQGEGGSQPRVPWYEADYDTQLTIHPGDTLVVTHRDDDDSIMFGGSLGGRATAPSSCSTSSSCLRSATSDVACRRAVQHSVLALLTVTLNDSLMSVLQ